MKAVVRTEYGSPDILKVDETEPPVPGDDQVLVEVGASSINTADLDQLLGRPLVARVVTGLTRPRSPGLGLDVVGVVRAVGKDVTRFEPGDEVWADMFTAGSGAFAQFVCASEKAFHPKPDGITVEQPATVPHSGLLALQGLDARGGVRSGQRVLINGAGGCVGLFATQIAKARGATVTGVDHPEKLDMIRSLRAHQVVDYTRDDFTRTETRYHFILDIAARRTLLAHRRALVPGGVYVQIARTMSGFARAALLGGLIGGVSRRRMGVFVWEPNRRRDLDRLAGMIENGEVTPVIDRRYPLAAVPEALRRKAAGEDRGKLVITT